MSYCFNLVCDRPENPDELEFCLTCHSPLLLKNRYRAIELIGAGNFGRTLLGEDVDRLKAHCIIKQFFQVHQPVPSDVGAIAKVTRRFEQEAKLLLELGYHPQIPTLLACFEQDKQFYIVQELIDGKTLVDEVLEEGAFSEQKIRDLLQELLSVLQFIHNHDVIHRDIKPMNILRRRSDCKLVLIDFGLAKQLNATTKGQTGSRYGTEGYAPIEQTRGKVYPASDLYSLGVTCIQLLTAADLEDIYDAEKGVWTWRQYLRQYETDVSDSLSQILDKLLKDSLPERYQSAAEVLQDLKDGVTRWQCVHIFSGHLDIVNKVAFSPDGKTIISSSDDDTLKVWDLGSGNLIQSISSASQGVNFVAMSPDGQIVASGMGDSTIQLWQTATEQLLYTLRGHGDVVHQVAFTPDGQILVSASRDGTIKLWQVGTGKLLNTLMGHSEAVRAVVVSPNGKIIVSASEDKTIKIWHGGSRVLLHNLTEHSSAVYAIAISPDSQTLTSGSADHTIRIWHLSNGKLIDILQGHSGTVRSVVFSPDGQTIASGSDDRTIKLWRRG